MENIISDYPGEWATSPLTSAINDNRVVFVTGRMDVAKYREKNFNIRIDVEISYKATNSGLPDDDDARLLAGITDSLVVTFKKNPVAVLTGIYTGDNKRSWIFYAKYIHLFQKQFNLALASFPLLNLTLYSENDPTWSEYDEMRECLET